jgi:hypothetical protein
VLYRMRIYLAVRDSLPAFHDFFRDYLLPCSFGMVPA